MRPETIFADARIVTPDAVLRGSVRVVDGHITEIAEGRGVPPGAVDCGGDLLLPGLVELHTDNLENHVAPRPNSDWPVASAMLTHDAQMATCGFTTVFDAIAVGDVFPRSDRVVNLAPIVEGIEAARAHGHLRAEHFLHLRCEVTWPELLDTLPALMDSPCVRIVSLMDHTPGQRQFAQIDNYRAYYQAKFALNEAEMARFIEERRADQERFGHAHRRAVAAMARERGMRIASHDDAVPAHVAEAVADGAEIAEFPTTMEAARAAHEAGLAVMMGAPNLVRGGSHSGNVAAQALAEAGLLDVVSSDYVPASALFAALRLPRLVPSITLPEAVAMVTAEPARRAGLDDRGRIEPGLRADLVRVKDLPDAPVVVSTWRGGARVA